MRKQTNVLLLLGLLTIFHLCGGGLCGSGVAQAAAIEIATAQLYVHDNSGLVATLDTSSPTYFSTLDANNLGGFGWTFTNFGAVPMNDLRLLVFLDADIDRDYNTFFNEYGEFVGLSLMSGAPGGAVAPTGWEIDEPGFLFGDIITNLQSGVLDNSNGVPSSTPDDVSLAMLFQIGSLDPGRMATLSMMISLQNIDGLRQVDPDSDALFYLNGYASVDLAPPVGGGEVPEPGTAVTVVLAGLAGLLFRACRKN